jgi:phage protein D
VAASVGFVPGTTASFYGYSDVTQPRYTDTTAKRTKLFCTGATYPLRDAGEAFWADGTPTSQVVAMIATQFRLSSSVTSTDVPAPPGPHNESWWGYLRRCADELGWVVRARATDIEFMPRRLDVDTQLLYVQDPRNQLGTQIYEFEATTGDTVPGARKATTAMGVADDGTVITMTDNSLINTVAARVVGPSLTGTVLARPVTSAAEAAVQLTAQAERSRFAITAEACLTGDSRIRNGATVLLRGLDDLNNGFWYVDEADHVVQQNTLYRTYVKLCRGGSGDPTPDYVPGPRVWFAPGDQVPTLPPAPQYVDGAPLALGNVQYGRWVASSPTARLVAV